MTTDRPDTRRARILAVARKHFGLYGYRRTVLDDIAVEAGCAKGSLYLEFPGKQALYFAERSPIEPTVREQLDRARLAARRQRLGASPFARGSYQAGDAGTQAGSAYSGSYTPRPSSSQHTSGGSWWDATPKWVVLILVMLVVRACVSFSNSSRPQNDFGGSSFNLSDPKQREQLDDAFFEEAKRNVHALLRDGLFPKDRAR